MKGAQPTFYSPRKRIGKRRIALRGAKAFWRALKWLRESDWQSFATRNARLTGATVHDSHRCRQLRTVYCRFSILLIRRRRPPKKLLEEHLFALPVADLPSSAFDRRP